MNYLPNDSKKRMEEKVSNYRNIYCNINLPFIICFYDKLDSKEIKVFSEITYY